MQKISVIIYNLGGPDSLSSVRKFLVNLFSDKNIINIKNNFLRSLLANFIAFNREKKSQDIYINIGGKSPIYELTLLQARELEKQLLNLNMNIQFKVEVMMRYFYPLSSDVIKKIEDFNPDEIFLIPLYPQFSTTTTLSSIEDFLLNLTNKYKTKAIGCYPTEKNFIKSHVDLILKEYTKYKGPESEIRFIFSAHGLPEKIVKDGDPYVWQVNQTVETIIKELKFNVDYVIAFQSKVGPLKWTGPSAEDEIKRAAKDNKSVLLIPITFVSEHSETLYELDIQFKELAQNIGIKQFLRAEALGINHYYIESLKDLCLTLLNAQEKDFVINKEICKDKDLRILKVQNKCPEAYSKCICK